MNRAGETSAVKVNIKGSNKEEKKKDSWSIKAVMVNTAPSVHSRRGRREGTKKRALI